MNRRVTVSDDLSAWQCILVDQTYFAPDEKYKLPLVERMLKKDDPAHPRLISYYRGH